jgi:hypothetical protein
MKKFVLAGLLGVAAIFATGCGNACEDAADTFKAKAEECDVEIEESDEEGEEVECTDALAEKSEKQAACIEKLTCAEFKDLTKLAACFQ